MASTHIRGIEVGDCIVLDKYEPYADYHRHKRETALVIHLDMSSDGYDVEWEDGEKSFVEARNARKVPPPPWAMTRMLKKAAGLLKSSGSPIAQLYDASETVEWTDEPVRVGDEVVYVGREYRHLAGKVGQVVSNKRGGSTWGVSFYDWHDGHTLDGELNDSSGYWIIKNELKKKKTTKVAPKKNRDVDITAMDALVIDKTIKDEIVSVLKQHQNHNKLFDEWGLGEVIEYGRGMTFMFYGPPGTGKTWGAHCIAKAMGAQLLIVSAAEIQSSEPGGANRAIQQAFKSAKESGSVLFLDECDSLITSRNDLGMVLASEVNTLFSEIEKFEGVCVLATNRVEHLDEALERRISLIVEFPAPNLANRKLIWAKLLPKKLPLEEGVKVDVLAKEPLTGGQIKNVVLQAARLALAEESKTVGLKHFKIAMERIKQSKNLLGTASRYHQGRVQDVGVGIGKSRSTNIQTFLDKVGKEDEEDDN